ncbi:SRPBCC family protein [Jiulongibacter sp. NS-SX5]|uniref:SRPBCC family protein n=1 Tax=Jiulongibacter sp. NS-SX5 TaxID=3463854 RepID=UPI004058E350
MKKMTIIGILIAVAIASILVYTTAQKAREINIQKSVLINAQMATVFNEVLYLENFPKWSPFLEADPTQQVEVKGSDGQVGAQYHWLGNGGKDVGYQEIKEVEPFKFIKMECDIQKPFKAKPVFEYRFETVGHQVKVTQDFHLKSSFMSAFFMSAFGVVKDMEKTNERGMELLKIVAEGERED